MEEFDKIWNFENLYQAHRTARLGKRHTKEVIEFELELGKNLSILSEQLRTKTYKIGGYYDFYVYDPKMRKIHALHYRDRVVQHCLCDEVLAPILYKKLIYDNAACRIEKGTHFALARVSKFLHQYHNKYGSKGYFLKYDIRKFFDNIDHDVLKDKLAKVIEDKDVLWLLFVIIDSFELMRNKGLPMGNQTSQWFAIYYMDSLDRFIKEHLRIKYYSRYMDDAVLLHHDREYLKYCLEEMSYHLERKLNLEFNQKTQIFPIKNGVDYLGFHTYLSQTGKIIRKVRRRTKRNYKKKLDYLEYAYAKNMVSLLEVKQVISSYNAHLSHGHTFRLRKKLLDDFCLRSFGEE